MFPIRYHSNENFDNENLTDDASIHEFVPKELSKLAAFNRLNRVRFEYELTFDHFERRTVVDSSVFSPPGLIDPVLFMTLETNHSHVSLILTVKHTIQKQLVILYKCSVLGEQKQKLYTNENKMNFCAETTRCEVFKYQKSNYRYGYNRQADPLRRTFQNIVIFHCEQTVQQLVLNKKSSTSLVQHREEAAESLIADMHALWCSRNHTDIVFIFSNGRQLRAHKLILSTRSAVFRAMFEHESLREVHENSIEIVNASIDAFHAFLYFVYTGKCDNIEQFSSELLAIGDKYQVNSLKTVCENHLCLNISPTTMFNLLLLADTHCALKLKAKVVEYISKNSTIQDAVYAAFSLNDPEQLVRQIRALTVKP